MWQWFKEIREIRKMIKTEKAVITLEAVNSNEFEITVFDRERYENQVAMIKASLFGLGSVPRRVYLANVHYDETILKEKSFIKKRKNIFENIEKFAAEKYGSNSISWKEYKYKHIGTLVVSDKRVELI